MAKYLEDQPAFVPQKPVAEAPPAHIDELGRDPQPYDFPVGPYWDPTLPINSGASTTFTDTYITRVYIDALVAKGFLRPNDRSDRALIWKAVQRALDVTLKDAVIESARGHEKRVADSLSSWGMGR